MLCMYLKNQYKIQGKSVNELLRINEKEKLS